MAKRIKKSNPESAPIHEPTESERVYHPIGEVFEFNGKRLRVERVADGLYTCNGCALRQSDGHCINLGKLACLPGSREDNTDVIFRDVTDEPTAAETTAQRVKDMEDLKNQVNEATTSAKADAWDIPLYKAFFFNGRWLMTVPDKRVTSNGKESDPCEGCVFLNEDGICEDPVVLKCSSVSRQDNTNVIFIEDPAHTPTPSKPVPMLDPKPEPLPNPEQPIVTDPVPTASDPQPEQQPEQTAAKREGVFYPIGQVFQHRGKYYRAEAATDCRYCVFRGLEGCLAMDLECSSLTREDKHSVIYVEVPDPVPTLSDPVPTDSDPAKREYHSSEKVIEPVTKEAPALDDDSANWPIAIPRELYDRLDYLGMLPNDIRDHNVGASNYAEHTIQPWAIWLDYPELTSWDHDILKRILRTKATDPRIVDYEKIIHICRERIRQLKYLEAHAE